MPLILVGLGGLLVPTLVIADHVPDLRQVRSLRFHATRWNPSPFEDTYGEWPPSPWRLLRALTARWFPYIRETDEHDEGVRNGLLNKLARELPDFVLPRATWPGPAIRQYHPLDLGKKYEADYSYRTVGTTLIQDQYRAVPPHDPVLWVWKKVELTAAESDLLKQLLRRVLYFGRAESHCRFRVLDGEPPMPNCQLSATASTGNPVLAATPGTDLNFESLLAITDSGTLKARRIPAGTAWFHAAIPPRPAAKPIRPVRRRHPDDLRVLQFAVGGRVYPPQVHWVNLTEGLRDRVIRERCCKLTGRPEARYADLNPAQRDDLHLIRGLHGDGGRVESHATTFFALVPDTHGHPTRLLCWRASPFTDDEIDAFLAAAEYPIRWEHGSEDWQVRVVPLPFSVPRPAEYWEPGRVWASVTPVVLPAGRPACPCC